MTSVPRWEPDGTESPAERTDPLLPAITDDMLPPLDLPPLPTLDDRSLAQMLAELEGDDADDPDPVGESPIVGDPTSGSADPASPDADPTSGPAPPAGRAATCAGGTANRPDHPLRLVEHPGGPVGSRPARTRARAAPGRSGTQSKYVRRDLHPQEVPADALTLTGITRRSRSRVGSILFKAVFVGIFLLILLQTIVSLLTPGV